MIWSSHMNNFKDVIKDLQETEFLSDVTLVCNDDTQIKAHKFVLIGSSPVLRTMLLQSSQKDTIVFLRGVDRRELQWVLEFMYIGETQVPQTRLQSFIELAKDLKMKGIHYDDDENDDENDDKKTAENAEEKVFEPTLPINNHEMGCEERNMDKQIKKETTPDIQDNKLLKNIKTPDIENGQQSFNLGSGQMAWEEDNNMDRYIEKAVIDIQEETLLKLNVQNMEVPDLEHGQQSLKMRSVKYPCDSCNYQANHSRNLKDHKATKHKVNPIFRCMVCDYCTNHTTAWKEHARRKHPTLQAQEIFMETRNPDKKTWSKHGVGMISD